MCKKIKKMNNSIYSSYPPPKLNFSSFNDIMPYQQSPMPQNLEYFQTMLPYFDYQIIDNFFEQKSDENNFKQTESPIKSTTNEESKSKKKENWKY